MKKIIVSLLVSLVCFLGYAQTPYPTPNPFGSKGTMTQAQGGWKIDSTAIMPVYADTFAANRSKTSLYAGSLIRVGDDYYYRSADTSKWLLLAITTSNCAGTQLISGSITWSGSGLVYDATDLDYYILCSRYFANSTTLTLSTADPTYGRIDKFYADNTQNIGVITGTPSANPQEPSVNPLTQIDLGFVYIPAGSTVPAGTTQTVIYNENVEWTGTSDVPSVNFDYATNPYIGSLSTYIPSAPNDSYISWQYGTTKRFIDVQYLKLWVRINEAFVSRPSPFLDVSFYNGSTKVSADSYVEDGVYNFDFNLIGEWQLVSIPLQGLVVSDSIFDKVNFVIHSAPTSFQLDYIYLLETATVPPVISSGWALNLNTGTNPTTNGIGTSDSVGVAIKTNSQTRLIFPANGIVELSNDELDQQLLTIRNDTIYKTNIPTAYGTLPIVVEVRNDSTFITCPTCDTTGGKWNLTGNAITSGQFLGTINSQDLVFKRNSTEVGRLSGFNVNFGVNSTTGTSGVGVGYNSGYLSSGINQTFIGFRSGESSTAASGATFIGNQSGVNNTGDEPTGIGYGAASNNTGIYLTSIGRSAGASNSGDSATFVGYLSGYNNSFKKVIGLGMEATPTSDNQLYIASYINSLFLDLDSASGTAPAIAGIDENGNWRKYATPSGGGGAPAGNYGNLQINRNSIFSTPASDSLTFSSATLAVKGALTTTGAITASGNVSANLGLFTSGVRTGNNTNFYWNSGPVILGNTNDVTIKNAAATAGANVSIGTSAAVKSAILDVNSTTKGALLPRMTGAEAEAISSPATGLIIYCNNANGSVITSVGLWNYDGSAWVTAGAKPYKILTGNLTQTGTGAPTFTILQNTTGVTYTTAYTGVGLYTLTANSGTPFTSNKTQVFIGGNIATVGGDNYFMNTSINSTTVIGISSGSYGIGFNDDILSNTPIEIRIYP